MDFLDEVTSSWPDISTAPRDGTKILLYVPSWGAIAEGRWEETHFRADGLAAIAKKWKTIPTKKEA